jgi:hypothetical protein
MKLIKLTDNDIHRARDFAFELVRAGKNGCFEHYFIGTLGEIAYGKFTNQKVNLEVYKRGVGDKGVDVKDAQVKTVSWRGANKLLKVGADDKSRTNAKVKRYILAHATITDPENVYLIGEVSKVGFESKCFYSRQYDCYMLSERELETYYNDTKESS